MKFSSAFCPNCGTRRPMTEPLSIDGNPNRRLRRNVLGGWAFTISLISLFQSARAPFQNISSLTIVFFAVAVVLTILAFRAANARGLKKGLTITALVFCCLSGFMLLPSILLGPSNTRDATVDKISAEATTPKPLSADKLKALCKEIPYKDIMRNPEKYSGDYITVTLKISQVLESGWVDSKTYYRCYSDSGSGLYFDNEYYLVDNRPDGAIKLLKDDVIQVYGRVDGAEEVTRALTLSSEEVLSITMLYCVLVDE